VLGSVGRFAEKRKKTGQSVCSEISAQATENQTIGFFAFIRLNLCTRHIQKKLMPRGHMIGRINARR